WFVRQPVIDQAGVLFPFRSVENERHASAGGFSVIATWLELHRFARSGTEPPSFLDQRAQPADRIAVGNRKNRIDGYVKLKGCRRGLPGEDSGVMAWLAQIVR